MNKAHFGARQLQLPATWNELSRRQVLHTAKVLFMPASESLLQARLICVLLQLRTNPRLAWQMIKMPLLDLEQFRQLTDFLIKAPANLTRQLLPTIRPNFWRAPWHGPGDRLAGLTFTEWIDAETAVYQYRQTNYLHHLNRLVAILYRPGKAAPDQARPPYVQHTLPQRTLEAAQLPLHVRQAILLYYDSCRRFYIDAYPEVFASEDELDLDDPLLAARPPAKPENPGPVYLRILRQLAGRPDRFTTMGQQPLNNIFFDLAERVKEAEALTETNSAKHD